MKNKRFLTLALSLLLTTGVVTSCGSNDKSSDSNTSTSIVSSSSVFDKTNVINDLENYVNLTDYSETNQQTINNIIGTYKERILASSNETEIMTLFSAACEEINNVKTLAQEALDVLNAHKEEVKNQIRQSVNFDIYDETDKQSISNYIDNACIMIDGASTIEEIDAWIDDVATYVSNFMTKEAKEALRKIQDKAIEELQNYIKDLADYTKEDAEFIEEIIETYTQRILISATETEINEALEEGKLYLDNVPKLSEVRHQQALDFVSTISPLEGVAKNYYTVDDKGNINFEGAAGRFDGFVVGDRENHQYVAFDFYLTPKYMNVQYSSMTLNFRMWDTSNTYEFVITDSRMTMQKKVWNSAKGGADIIQLQTSYRGLKNNQTYHIQILACEWAKSFCVDGETIFTISEGDFTVGYSGVAAWETSFTIYAPVYTQYADKGSFLDDYQDLLWGECIAAKIGEAEIAINDKIESLVCDNEIKELIRGEIEKDLEDFQRAQSVNEVNTIADSIKAKIDELFLEYGSQSMDEETKAILVRMKNARDFLKSCNVTDSSLFEVNGNGYLNQKDKTGWTGLYFNDDLNANFEVLDFDFTLLFGDSMWSTLNMSYNRLDDGNRYGMLFNDISVSCFEKINNVETPIKKVDFDKHRQEFINVKIMRLDNKRAIFFNNEKVFEINNCSMAGGTFALETWQTNYQIGNIKYNTYDSLAALKMDYSNAEADVVNIPNVVEPKASEALKTALKGKNMSILADSISTYEGVSNSADYNSTIGNNGLYYYQQMCSVNDTWWMQTINETDMNLCVNNSWAGSRAYGQLNDPSTACGDRAVNLHNDHTGVSPDIVATYLGTNDFDMSTPLGTFNSLDDIYSNGQYKDGASLTFATAYAMMIHKIQQRYPGVEIYCFTILRNNVRKDYDILTQFNNVIKNIADYFGCKIVDLCADCGMNETNALENATDPSGIHPNRKGMDKISQCFINELEKNYCK